MSALDMADTLFAVRRFIAGELQHERIANAGTKWYNKLMIKAIIFDLDDTICNTSDILDQALRNTFAENLAHFPSKTVEEMMLINQEAFKETFLNPNIPVSSSTILI